MDDEIGSIERGKKAPIQFRTQIESAMVALPVRAGSEISENTILSANTGMS